MTLHQFRDQHGDVAIGVLALLLDGIFNNGFYDEPIRRVQYNQLGNRSLQAEVLLLRVAADALDDPRLAIDSLPTCAQHPDRRGI